MAILLLKIARDFAKRVSLGRWFQSETVLLIIRLGVYSLEVDTISLNFNKMADWNCHKTMHNFIHHAQPAMHPLLV